MDLSKVVFLPRAEKDLKNLSPEIQKWLLEAMEKLNPELADIKKIKGIKPALLRLAIGDYRLLFRRLEDKMVLHRIIDRKDLDRILRKYRFC